MKKTGRRNIGASVRQRLYDAAKRDGEDFALALIRFAGERWLYRLSVSEFASRFCLKGASRLNLWFDRPNRPTRDLDLLGLGAADAEELAETFRSICAVECEDGLVFPHGSLKIEEIRAAQLYPGLRARFTALLDGARIAVQVDVGFGDAVTPAAEPIELPSVLGYPGAKLLGYPKETVIAEKFEALVKLGMANSRMKDLWDLRHLIESFEFAAAVLAAALEATFARRGTPFPAGLPVALTKEFAADKSKLIQWNAYLRTTGLGSESGSSPNELGDVIDLLARFFGPLIGSLRADGGGARFWDGLKWRPDAPDIGADSPEF